MSPIAQDTQQDLQLIAPLNLVAEPVAGDITPATAQVGRLYRNTVTNRLMICTDASTVIKLSMPSDQVPTAPSGRWWLPPVSALAAAISTSADRNLLRLIPIDIPVGFTSALVGANITVASSGGAAVVLRHGLYADDGSGCMPALAAPLFDWGTQACTGTTTTTAPTISDVLGQPPGRYWLAHVLQYTTVPTTFPTFQIINSGPILPTGALAGSARGWSASVSAAGALPSLSGATFTTITTPWLAGIKAA